MKRKRIVFVALIVFCALLFLCCDRKGTLNKEEKTDLAAEIKSDFEAGELWSLEPVFQHEDEDIDDSISFLRAAAETVFDHEELISHLSGLWQGKNSKSISISCSIPFGSADGEFVIDSLQIAKYYNRPLYKINLYFHKDGEEPSSRFIMVRME
jgi:hypothetical protein